MSFCAGTRVKSLSEDIADANAYRSGRRHLLRDLHWGRALALTAALGAVAWALAAGCVPCVFAEVMHAPCPGCGSTRAVQALLAGDFTSSHGVLRMNPLGPALAAVALAACAGSIASVLRHGTAARFVEHRAGRILAKAGIVVALLEVALWAARLCGALGGPVPV
jgi:hypothetical protein